MLLFTSAALIEGFRWWKQFRQGEDMGRLIHDLAMETRREVRDQGDWPFQDSFSTGYVLSSGFYTQDYGDKVMRGHAPDVSRLLTNAIGATIAVLAVAAPKIPNTPRGNIDCPSGQVFRLARMTRQITDADGQPGTEEFTVPGCGAPQSLSPVPLPPSISTIAAAPGTGGTGGIGGTGGTGGTGGSSSCIACNQLNQFQCPSFQVCSAGCCEDVVLK